MSNRFHSKFHRQNHHTYSSPTNPDSGNDPIASFSNPFNGDFVLTGGLSANVPYTSAYSAVFSGGNVGIKTNTPIHSLTVAGSISAANNLYFNTLRTAVSSSVAVGSYVGKIPLYGSDGIQLGYLPIYK